MNDSNLSIVPSESLLDLKSARVHEAERRLRMLGELAQRTNSDADLRARSFNTLIPVPVLKSWWHQYRSGGLDGLCPNWAELEATSQEAVRERYADIGELAEAETLRKSQVTELSHRLSWAYRTTLSLLISYRIGGLWALATDNQPSERHPLKEKSPPRDMGALDNNALEVAYHRRDLLGPLAEKAKTGRVSEAEVVARTEELAGENWKISRRTLWNYIRDYRHFGMAGLAPRLRADKSKFHNLSEEMVEIVEGIRLSNRDLPVRAVYKRAVEIARQRGENPPSRWQVRSICLQIPAAVKRIADGREDEYRNNHRLTYPRREDVLGAIYEIDHTKVDVLVKDMRPKHKTPSEEVRPWLTLVIERNSRLVVAALFSYDQPDRFTVASAIRDSLLTSDTKPFGGGPDAIRVDQGKDLVSDHVRRLVQELGIRFEPLRAHYPEGKGVVERFFGTLNTRLWSSLPGYVASSPEERNPRARAELTLTQLVEKFWSFIREYHSEVHSQTRKSPSDCWLDLQYLMHPVDPRQLDLLLKEVRGCYVSKQGIRYRNRYYWHPEFSGLEGEYVLIRAAPVYEAPDEIEVLHLGQWICTAFATDSPKGLALPNQRVAMAQHEQRESIRSRIKGAREALQDAEREIAQAGGPQKQIDTAGEGERQPPQREVSHSVTPKQPKSDFLERIENRVLSTR